MVKLETVAEVMGRPWAWGEADCCASACDVFARWYGIDLMAGFRGRYSTQIGAARIINRMGGFAAMAERMAAQAGLDEGTRAPGEIGVVIGADGGLALGVSYAPGIWAAKTETGFAATGKVLRCWRA